MRLRGTMGCYPKLLKNETKCVNTVELVVCSLYLHMRYDLIIGIILYIIPFKKKKKKILPWKQMWEAVSGELS